MHFGFQIIVFLTFLVFEICFGTVVIYLGMTTGGHMAVNVLSFAAINLIISSAVPQKLI